jgi:hypothetical protein
VVRPCGPCNAAQCMLNSSCSAAPRYPAQPTATRDHAQRIDRIHRVVARIRIRLPRLVDQRVDVQELPRLRVVVAVHEVVEVARRIKVRARVEEWRRSGAARAGEHAGCREGEGRRHTARRREKSTGAAEGVVEEVLGCRGSDLLDR